MSANQDIVSKTLVEEIPVRTVLYTTFYRAQSQKRQDELLFCLEANLECKNLDAVFLICEDGIEPTRIIRSSSSHIVKHFADKRQTYRDIFNHAAAYNPDGYNIFCNSDIFITDETIAGIKERIPQYSKKFLALTRWNWHDGNPEMNEGRDSQDTWCWFGIVPKSVKADFLPGRPGCDNAIADRLKRHYQVLNPSLSVKTYHVHASGEHTYATEGEERKRQTIPPPYYYPEVTK